MSLPPLLLPSPPGLILHQKEEKRYFLWNILQDFQEEKEGGGAMEHADFFNPWKSWKVAVLLQCFSSYIVPHPCIYRGFVQAQLVVRNASLGKQTICLNLLLLQSSAHVGAQNNLLHPWKTNVPCSTCTIKTFWLKSRPLASWRNKRTSWFPT